MVSISVCKESLPLPTSISNSSDEVVQFRGSGTQGVVGSGVRVSGILGLGPSGWGNGRQGVPE